MEKDVEYRHFYLIKCEAGHESEFRLPEGGDFPNVIRCPQRLPNGSRCKKPSEITKSLKEIAPKNTKKKTNNKEVDVKDTNEYTLQTFINKTNIPEIAELLIECHQYCLDKGLVPIYRKHYISFTLNKRAVARLGMGKKFMSMPFNSRGDFTDERIKDTTDAVGDNFMYMWTKIVPTDIDDVKARIDDCIIHK